MPHSRCGVTLALLSLLAGTVGAVSLGSGEVGQLYVIAGTPLSLNMRYPALARRRIHSVSWKVDEPIFRRILQYIVSNNKTYPSSTYRGRFRFHSENGTLVLRNFTSRDAGLYCITVTDVEGAEQTACTLVRLYEQISALSIEAFRSAYNLTLHCSAQNGTDLHYHWLKDGENLTETNDVLISDDGQRLALTSRNPTLCGIFTCLVTNKLGQESVTKTVSETDGFASCMQIHKPRERQSWLIVTGIMATLILLACAFQMVLKRGSRGL
ncbi:hepatic and glial cell adhesion molecule-like isoform X2 [Stegostoma tigrinum]|uniref:hepatic and glial cell adhesion molecule-like isoform X2 n=1 Tax=Stegostoma tigrinum TaxID=3053191 RepID=UPI00202B3E7E|nr:hepatic and glial cell adhesion molecule-like isoform X2 [Stegostoma tigrinum]